MGMMTLAELSTAIDLTRVELAHELESHAANSLRVAARLRAGKEHAANSLGEFTDGRTSRINYLSILLAAYIRIRDDGKTK